jgi:aspartyl-tRNA(Asn)/glutamyl-tRNA(Gln) amidotransferase subunit C
MKIDRDEARRIAALAHLEFDGAGLDRMAAEMTAILSYIDQLQDVDVDSIVASTGSPTPMREDEARPGVGREEVERNAPSWRDGQFVVPRVIE